MGRVQPNLRDVDRFGPQPGHVLFTNFGQLCATRPNLARAPTNLARIRLNAGDFGRPCSNVSHVFSPDAAAFGQLSVKFGPSSTNTGRPRLSWALSFAPLQLRLGSDRSCAKSGVVFPELSQNSTREWHCRNSVLSEATEVSAADIGFVAKNARRKHPVFAAAVLGQCRTNFGRFRPHSAQI